MGIHMGIGYGPVDALLKITVGEKTAWSGRATHSQTININAGKLFGGDKGEGGIDGPFELMMGEPTQVPSEGLKKMLGGLVPGFRRKVTGYFNGLICAMNPYPKTWEFMVERILKGWDGAVWYQEKAVIELEECDGEGNLVKFKAMNPAHVIYECCTNRDWGRGMSRSRMDDAEFRKMADTLYDEKFGLCIAWYREDTINAFIQTVLDHIHAVLVPDKTTGKYRPKLLRADYNLASLPQMTVDSGILSFNEVSLNTVPETVNELTITWHNPITDSDGTVRLHNQASIQSTGAILSDSKEYTGIPTQELAMRVCLRDLKLTSIPLRRFELECDHTFYSTQPGDVIRLRDVTRGIDDMAVRVATTEESDITKGGIKITAVQDLYSLPMTSFGGVQPPSWTPPDTKPALARRRVYEIPYIDLNAMLPKGEFAAIGEHSGYLGVAGEQPTPLSLGYELAVKNPYSEGARMARVVTAADGFVEGGAGSFAPVGDLNAAMSYLDTKMVLSNTTNLEDVEAGAGVMVGEEIMRVEVVAGATITVARGCADTVPQQHNAGETVWFYRDDIGGDAVEYLGGENIGVKVMPYTRAEGTYPIEATPIDPLAFNWRFFRPYAPGNVMMNNTPWFNTQVLNRNTPTLAVSWAHRDRVLQADKLIEHQQGDIGPETGQAYVVRVKNDAGEVIRQEAGIQQTGWSYLWAQALKDLGVESAQEGDEYTITIDLFSQRQGYDSWQGYTMRVRVQDLVFYLQAAQLAEQAAQEAGYRDLSGTQAAQAALQAGQGALYRDIDGVAAAQFAEAASQLSAMPTAIDAVAIESPYTFLLKEGFPTADSRIVAAAARPSDRLTDGYDLLTSGVGDDRVPTGGWNNAGAGKWTPWVLVTNKLDYLDTVVEFSESSEADGVPLDIMPGDMALMDDEIVRVDSVNGSTIIIARGCLDTIPVRHGANKPMWFFDRNHGVDTRTYKGDAEIVTRLRPHTFTVEYPLDRLPNLRTQFNTRPTRPFAPGLVLADGQHWFKGAVAWQNGDNDTRVGRDVSFTWRHRDRLLQGENVVDHMAGNIGPEPGVEYRIWIGYASRNASGGASTVTLREVVVSGTSWIYPAEWALADGYKAARAFDSCGTVNVNMTIFAKRGDVLSFMGYPILITLPAPNCPPGQNPGGGPTPTPPPPDGNDGDNPGDGGDNGNNGGNPTDPTDPGDNPDPDWPPENPDPENPDDPDKPDPDDPNFTVAGWGNNWDHEWGKDLK